MPKCGSCGGGPPTETSSHHICPSRFVQRQDVHPITTGMSSSGPQALAIGCGVGLLTLWTWSKLTERSRRIRQEAEDDQTYDMVSCLHTLVLCVSTAVPPPSPFVTPGPRWQSPPPPHIGGTVTLTKGTGNTGRQRRRRKIFFRLYWKCCSFSATIVWCNPPPPTPVGNRHFMTPPPPPPLPSYTKNLSQPSPFDLTWPSSASTSTVSRMSGEALGAQPVLYDVNTSVLT